MGTAFHRSYPIPQTGLLLTSTVLAIVPAREPGIVLPRRGNDAGRGRVAPALPLLPGAAAGLFPPVVPASAAIIAGLAAGLFLLMAVVPMLMAAAPFRSAAAVHSVPAAIPTAAAISTAAAAAKQ